MKTLIKGTFLGLLFLTFYAHSDFFAQRLFFIGNPDVLTEEERSNLRELENYLLEILPKRMIGVPSRIDLRRAKSVAYLSELQRPVYWKPEIMVMHHGFITPPWLSIRVHPEDLQKQKSLKGSTVVELFLRALITLSEEDGLAIATDPQYQELANIKARKKTVLMRHLQTNFYEFVTDPEYVNRKPKLYNYFVKFFKEDMF